MNKNTIIEVGGYMTFYIFILCVISLIIWAIYSTTTRDRRFEDACRANGGRVVSAMNSYCSITLVPQRESILSISPK